MKKALLVLGVILAVSGIIGCGAVTSNIKNKHREGFSFSNFKSIIVFPFVYENIVNFASADIITESLMDTKLITVDRALLKQILNEQKLSLSGATDNLDLNSIGKLTNAELILVGSFQGQNGFMGRSLSVTIKIIEIKTGNIVFTTSAKRGDVFGGREPMDLADELTKEIGMELVKAINDK